MKIEIKNHNRIFGTKKLIRKSNNYSDKTKRKRTNRNIDL